ncbi:hypothetical protein ACH42_05385 [Endozoicomonas sp. (ex Bugula neritina AB1)]|nr:hypothetical protein ACH42_05385 [Endozoicomonas sp. (ex Bugula neritina AB1)]
MIRGETYSDSKTFGSLTTAKAWERRRLAELDGVKSVAVLEEDETQNLTIGELIDQYIKKTGTMGRSKTAVLNSLKGSPVLSHIKLNDFKPQHLFNYCRIRVTECEPQTIWQDISFLRSVFKQARVLLALDIDDEVFIKAMPTLKEHNLVSKSKQRSRKASTAELDLVLQHLRQPNPKRTIPVADIVEFAFESSMRRSEVCQLKWSNLEADRSIIKIMERKDPSNKHTNDQDVPLTPRALEIILAQPKTSVYIFPYKPDSIRAAWSKACKKLGINDLRYHDLRRTGLTRLIEAGLTEFEVRQISGHKDVRMLQRYVNISPEQVAEKLKGLDVV